MPFAGFVAWIYGKLDPSLPPSTRATRAIMLTIAVTLALGLIGVLVRLAVVGNLH
jgi:hypothetical protein